MGTLLVDRCGEIVLARLNHRVTNALDLASVNELARVIAQVRSDSAVRGLVLASANDKFFSIGFDIPQLYEFSAEEFKSFFQLNRRFRNGRRTFCAMRRRGWWS